jgi:hypothetical protein
MSETSSLARLCAVPQLADLAGAPLVVVRDEPSSLRALRRRVPARESSQTTPVQTDHQIVKAEGQSGDQQTFERSLGCGRRSSPSLWRRELSGE